MRLFILSLLCLSSCTVLHDPKSGHVLLFTTASADRLALTSPNVSLEVTNLRHESASAIIGAGGAAGTALGLGVAIPH